MATTSPHKYVPKAQKEFAKDALQQSKRVKTTHNSLHVFNMVATAEGTIWQGWARDRGKCHFIAQLSHSCDPGTDSVV